MQFVGGGWVQNDETLIPYTDVIDQTTTGHEFLKKALNYTVQRGWQIDMFTGMHSKHMAYVVYMTQLLSRLQWRDTEHVGAQRVQ